MSAAAAIEIKGVCKRFGGNEVLRGVDLTVPRGSTTVILGASGSGKSVLIKHVIGLLKPDAGEIWIEGDEIAGAGERALNEVRKKFGMVFQGAALFDSMSVGENVAFPLREHTRMDERGIRRTVTEKLELFGLHGVEDKFPAELSGGMRKRVGLARAVVLNPGMILYDEPTTGLDPISTENVNEMIVEAREKLRVTSVVISHDIGAAFAIADAIAVLHEGRMVEFGTPPEVRASAHPHVRQFLSTWFSRT